MGYSSLERLRKINKERFGIDGPFVPEPFDTIRVWEKDEAGNRKSEKTYLEISDLEKHAVHFIREKCSDLRFLRDEEHLTLKDFDGTSLKAHQIPYNMEKDLDRRCLEVAIHRFLESGTAKEAFDIYFCYLEMFIGKYGQSKKMIEMLSEFESNASSLLMKHRDHYSHSAYVFLIGLAFYDESSSFREAYKTSYGKLLAKEGLDSERENDLAAHFLKYWGLTSLFHDIGYPFELSFEQVKSYFGDTIDKVPYVTFHMNDFQIKTDDADIEKLKRLLPGQISSGDINRYLARAMANLFGRDYSRNDGDYEEYLFDILNQKPAYPDKFGGYIDHAYFSTILLIDNLLQVLETEELNEMYTHALVAILLHNSLYKFSITNIKNEFNEGRHFNLNRSPLSYLLMLCDELQCWDRIAYGQKSRGEVHPFDCKLEFAGDKIKATYLFDENYTDDVKRELTEHYRTVKGTYKKLEPDAENKSDFLRDIESIISINGDESFGERNSVMLEVNRRFECNKRFRKAYLSTSSFIHLYKFAVMVHQMNHIENISKTEMEEKFNEMSLEYKINHISRAKSFARLLSKAGCFYSDQQLDFELVREFDDEFNRIMGPAEHERWCWEHWIMGWRYGAEYKNNKYMPDMDAAVIRECTRTHIDMPQTADGIYTTETGIKHFEALTVENGHDKDSKEKDIRSLNNLLKVLSEEDGIKVYRI